MLKRCSCRKRWRQKWRQWRQSVTASPGEQTAMAILEVAWSALFAREFPKALAASDRGHTLLPHNLSIETNRAHALMFIGHVEEARALYLAHKGKPLSDADNKLWEQVI